MANFCTSNQFRQLHNATKINRDRQSPARFPRKFQSTLYRPLQVDSDSQSRTYYQQCPPLCSPRNPNLSPLCFHGLTNCFSRNSFPLINICVAPRVWGSACNFLVTHRRPLRPLTPFAATHAKVMHASPFPATHPKKPGVP